MLSGAQNIAVDGGDVVYIGDDRGTMLIRSIDSSGTISNTTPFFTAPASIAVDNFGIIYSANSNT